MKKTGIIAAAGLAALISSCSSSAPKADMKTDVDSLSYSIGMAQTQGLKPYLVNRLGVDTTYLAEFVKGLNEGANAGDDKKKTAYYAGIQIGQQVSQQMIKGINYEVFGNDSTQTISLQNFLAGFIAGVMEKGGQMTLEQAQELAQAKMKEVKRLTAITKKPEKSSWRTSPRRPASRNWPTAYITKSSKKATVKFRQTPAV